MYNPASTYRLQFHKEFTFDDFERIIPYLKALGVSTIYASPIFQSVPGSTHGYDGLNPHQINPEIGTGEQLIGISAGLQQSGIGWLQDIVPNHMAYDPGNAWLMDVLEKGNQSVFAPFFDSSWTSSFYQGKIMVPFLGSSLEDVLNAGDLKLHYENNRFVLKYYDSSYPLNARFYELLLKEGSENTEALQQLLDQMQGIHQVENPKEYSEGWNEFLMQFSSLMKNESVKNTIDNSLQEFNNNKEKLLQICDEQHYQLCHWQDTDKKINFRRFFTVNGLICLNIQDNDVFKHFHQYIAELYEKGIFQGLRIDHIDGLYDPARYLEQLRTSSGEDAYIVVEKILEPGEDIPRDWPIQGNTGYDFLAVVNNLLTNPEAEKPLTKFYEKLTGDKTPVKQQIHNKKAHILNEHMNGELDNLFHLFMNSNLVQEDQLAALQAEDLKAAIAEFLILCPVYRYYGNQLPLTADEKELIGSILNRIKKTRPYLADAVQPLEYSLLEKPEEGDEDYNKRALTFYQRCMQFTGPLMAKGVEDTLMYTYNRFAGHNEVGDSPETFGLSVENFHEKMTDRQINWPLSINGTSTHDTKRGEDVRARLNVLTDISDEWLEQVKLWQQLNAGLKKNFAPDLNDEYFIYQTLAGAYPMPGEDDDNFESRLSEYLEKALREAKVHSNWSQPDEDYENAAKTFAAALLDSSAPFWKSFREFHARIAGYGMLNSLSQLLLKFTCPGVPDVYQGCELWDLSLVDPDNRRAVDYDKRAEWLNELESKKNDEDFLTALWENKTTGKIKLWLTKLLLNERRSEKETFEKADYIPLKVKGDHKENVLAFARRYQHTWYITVVPLHAASLTDQQNNDPKSIQWGKTRVILPADAPAAFENILQGTKGSLEKELFVKDLFRDIPLALLKLKQPSNNRGAGILLHITSLPSPYGTGDFGKEAKEAVDFLAGSRQKYWQILPLSPTEAGQGYSPYSAISSMAGNTMLISPDLLAIEGLLDKKDLKKHQLPVKDKADFKRAEKIREPLFEQAFSNFKNSGNAAMKSDFELFCEKESYWLEDYALYLTLKSEHSGKPWYQWPEEYRLRRTEALDEFKQRTSLKQEKVKWLQFIFMRQWQELKAYSNSKGIEVFGDLPFYVSYDSADVWSNPGIFCLDEAGKATGIAGVPPDYFNDNGQLWGMPVFRWEVLKAQDYDWWIKRISKNMELYDVLRLDHFRAFSTYWDVPAGEETAKNGEWKPGPGADFFKVLEQKLGKLPFVAEDLGDIDQPVYDLRDEFEFPGMKVLQFAFGEDLPISIDIPHNYTANFFAYTGTHDNNTTLGWYRKDIDKDTRKRLENYTGSNISEKTVNNELSRLAYASVAKTVIIPMQDVLKLDESARMNIPSSSEGNWAWRLKPGAITKKHQKRLKNWVSLYNRY